MTQVDATMAGNSRASLAFYAFARFLVVSFARLMNRVAVEGREHVPVTGAFVLAPVHRSNMDTPYAAVATRRRLRYMGKDTLWARRWSGWLLSALGAFPVTRGVADRSALERGLAVLCSGEPLVVFPEGTRKSGPLVQPLFEGAAYLATKAQVPIVPMGIGGSERAMPKGSKLIRPTKVHVVIGAPMAPPALVNGRLPRPEVKALTAELHDVLQRLFDEAQVRAGT